MAWDGISIPTIKFRLRWVMKDELGNRIALSAWTPNDQGSYSQANKPSGATVVIEGETQQPLPYELREIMSSPVTDVDSIEYLVLLVNGKHNHVGMGFVRGNQKKWALTSGDTYEETV